MPSSISKLTGLLRECGVAPRITTENIVPHISYDHEYRVAVLAIVFGELAETEGSTKKIRYQHLGLYQFVLLHPHLLRGLSDWTTEYHHRSHNPLEEIWNFPNSFSSDTTFKEIYTYFTIFGHIQQIDDYATIDITKNTYFFEIYDRIIAENLFKNVIEVARQLRAIRIPKKVLAK